MFFSTQILWESKNRTHKARNLLSIFLSFPEFFTETKRGENEETPEWDAWRFRERRGGGRRSREWRPYYPWWSGSFAETPSWMLLSRLGFAWPEEHPSQRLMKWIPKCESFLWIYFVWMGWVDLDSLEFLFWLICCVIFKLYRFCSSREFKISESRSMLFQTFPKHRTFLKIHSSGMSGEESACVYATRMLVPRGRNWTHGLNFHLKKLVDYSTKAAKPTPRVASKLKHHCNF